MATNKRPRFAERNAREAIELDMRIHRERQMRPPENLEHPSYYAAMKPEPIKVARAWGLNFNLGSVIKYVGRGGKKPGVSLLDDLKKARGSLNEEIEALELEGAK